MKKNKKIFICCTEQSGENIAYNICKRLEKYNYQIDGVGGQLSQKYFTKKYFDISIFKSLGFIEIILSIPKFIKIINFLLLKILKYNYDLVILIDSPDFNYQLAKKLKKNNFNNKIIQIVAPTVWAWREGRAKKFSLVYDEIFTLFKFENKYFTKFKLQTEYVGHQIFFKNKIKEKKKVICFLPGSRNIEIQKNLSKMLPLIRKSLIHFSEYEIFLLTFEHSKKMVVKMLDDLNVKVLIDFKKKQAVMKKSFLAIAASGSVSLELCKYQVPSIIVYDTHFITKLILKLFVKVNFASLINIFYNREIIPEFLFEKFNQKNVFSEIHKLVKNKKKGHIKLK